MGKERSFLRYFSLIKKIRGTKRNDYGKIEKVRFFILESKENVSKEGVIREIFPCVLGIFTKIIEIYNNKKPELDANNVEILEIKTAGYESASITSETFAKIIVKIKEKKDEEEKDEEIEIESYIGKAVGFHDDKIIEIFFERGVVTVDFSSEKPVRTEDPPVKIDESKDIDGNIKDPISRLLKDIDENKLCKSAFSLLCWKFREDSKIKDIIEKIKNKVGKSEIYKKFSSLNEILRKFEIPDERYKASIKVLLDQYNNLRSEITQSIYLEQAAIIVLYTFLGVAVAYLLREGIAGTLDFSKILKEPDLRKIIPFLVALNFAQVIICGLGSLFLREQARNRRACSFQKAIEYIINQKIGGTGIYWENYITSPLIEKEIGFWDYFKLDIPINREYYKNRRLGIGLPIVLPNVLVFTGIVCMAFASVGKIALVYYIFSIISGLITYWAYTIARKSCFPLKEEIVPSREEVLYWIEKENRKLL